MLEFKDRTVLASNEIQEVLTKFNLLLRAEIKYGPLAIIPVVQFMEKPVEQTTSTTPVDLVSDETTPSVVPSEETSEPVASEQPAPEATEPV